jgi:hypothetical protein
MCHLRILLAGAFELSTYNSNVILANRQFQK